MPIQVFSRKNSPIPPIKIRQSLESLLKHAKTPGALVEVSLVGEKKIRDLNRRYLGKDKVTDVISFPLDPKSPFDKGPWVLGEIYIAVPVAKWQAGRAGRPLLTQVIRLGVHGLIHLQGLDHDRSAKARKEFEALETRYLKYLNRRGLIRWDGSLQF